MTTKSTTGTAGRRPDGWIRGAYTALVTPFTADGSAIDLDRLDAAIERQAAGGVSGVVPCGTTGEAPTLSEREHAAVVERTIATAHGLGLQVIAGAGSNSTRHAVALHRLADRLGADAALQVVPYYNKPSQDGLRRHFTAIADSCDLPIVLYDVPTRTSRALAPETVERLSEHPNIVAIKDATGSLDRASETLARTGLTLLCGDDTLTLPMASVGGTGVISVLSNVVPDRVAQLCAAFLGGGWETARAIHFELFDLARGLLTLDVNPVPVKAALALLGHDTGAVRGPLAPASRAVVERIAAILEGAGQPATAPVA